MCAMRSIAIFIFVFAVAGACLVDAGCASAENGSSRGSSPATANKSWNEHLAKMERPAPETGVRRFRFDGVQVKVYFDAQFPLERGSSCSLAVVVIHGWGGGFTRSNSQAALIGEFTKMKRLDEDIPYVIAPLFPRDDLAEKRFGKVDGLATWNR